MNTTITISQSAYKELINRLSRVEKMLANLIEKFEQEPAEGTRAWWEWSVKKGRRAIKKGEYIDISTDKQIDEYSKSL